jgi:hypothetical protein
LKDEADKIANTMDLHSVKLKFEAFVERNGFREQICPPEYSQAIHNLSKFFFSLISRKIGGEGGLREIGP